MSQYLTFNLDTLDKYLSADEIRLIRALWAKAVKARERIGEPVEPVITVSIKSEHFGAVLDLFTDGCAK